MALSLALHSTVSGQGTTFPTIPRAEYYSGLILLQEGNLDEAQELFVLGLGRAMAPGEPRGIESIPFLAALGECEYQRGNLAAALDWHEAVMQLVNQTQGWTQWVEPIAVQGLKTNADDRGLSFLASPIQTRSASPSGHWRLMQGIPGVFLVVPSLGIFPQALQFTIDAPEIQRSIGLTLRRRSEILGPLVGLIDSSSLADAALRAEPFSQDPIVQAGSIILQEISASTLDPQSSRAERLLAASQLPGGLDHPMSSIAWLAISDQAIHQRRWADAMIWAEAALKNACQWSQTQVAVEAVRSLGVLTTTQRIPAARAPFLRLVSWAKDGSSQLIGHALLAEAQRLLTLGEIEQSAAALQPLEKLFARRRWTALPLTSQAAWIHYRLAVARGLSVEADTRWQWLVKSLRTDAAFQSSAIPIFRLHWLLEARRREHVADADLLLWLPDLLQVPDPHLWKFHPQAAVLHLNGDLREGYQAWQELAWKRGDESERWWAAQSLHRWQQARAADRSGGRVATLRRWFFSLPDTLPPSDTVAAKAWQDAYPELAARAKQYLSLRTKIARDPQPWTTNSWSMSKWTEAEQKSWMSLITASQELESTLQLLATNASEIELDAPAILSLKDLQTQLHPQQAVLAFTIHSSSCWAMMVSAERVSMYRVGEVAAIESLVASLWQHLGVDQDPNEPLGQGDMAWQADALQLRDMLLPNAVRGELEQRKHWTIVPMGPLWCIPFELLPSPRGDAWIASHNLSYAASIGWLATQFLPASQPTDLRVVHQSGFWLPDAVKDQNLTDALANQHQGSVWNPWRDQGNPLPSRWIGLQSKTLLAAGWSAASPRSWAPLGYDRNDNEEMDLRWSLLPSQSPRILLLPGASLPGRKDPSAVGYAIDQFAAELAASSNRVAMIARWPVRGASTHLLLDQFLKELSKSPPSIAWQTAVKSSWNQKLDPTLEPTFTPAAGAAMPIDPRSPKFWAGNLLLGNSAIDP
ncbi:MAG: hypothetical protein ACK5PD_15335 [Pirellulaceae bacterium]